MLDGISIIGLTPGALLLVVVIFIMTGRLVPKATLQAMMEDRDRWRAAYENERAARTLSDAQTRELLEVAKTSEKFLSAVFDKSERILQSGDS